MGVEHASQRARGRFFGGFRRPSGNVEAGGSGTGAGWTSGAIFPIRREEADQRWRVRTFSRSRMFFYRDRLADG
jgi:hypothetical protein